MQQSVRPQSAICVLVVLASILAVVLGAGAPVEARITSITITSTTSPTYGGATFGAVGDYEQLDGIATGEIDPNDPANAIITDIKLAPTNGSGMVPYSMNISILKPRNMSKANGTLIYDVVNRGSKRITAFNIGGGAGTAAGQQGDGLLQRQGFTMAWSGWENDITGGIRIDVPAIAGLTGRVRSEYILNSTPESTVDITSPPVYEAASTDNSNATLTRRVHQHDPREPIPNDQWAFADCSTAPFPGVPSTRHVCLQGGFDTNHIYELVYTATNPTLAGLGFAATRDFISFLRNSNGARHGDGNRKKDEPVAGPANPLGTSINNVLIFGSSQSGRWIRTFLQQGFNQDERGRQVVDGAMPHIASNRGAFNVRFAQPTRLSGTQHEEAQFPGSESPNTWGTSHDGIAGITGGQLDRCRKTNSCPKILQTVSDTEYWQALMSLNTTDVEGRHDIPLPPDVRLFLFAATHHGGGNPLQQPPALLPNRPGHCQLRANSNPYVWHQRALLLALHQWVVRGVEPPASLYPKLGDGTLVRASHVRVPYIPAVNFTLAGLANRKFLLDRGPGFNVEDITGVMDEPPVVGREYAVFVPQVDADGNTFGGLRNVNARVPLGTYTGWNIRRAGFSEGDSCDLTGAFIPFFKTQAERQNAGDPRPSLAERYPTHADYVARVTAAANDLVAAGLLLQEDATRIINAASAAAVP